MDTRDHDLYLLNVTGEERRSFEEKRWVFVLLTLIPLVTITTTYMVQLHQTVREPYIILLYPVLGPVMLAACLWNVLGGYSRAAENVTAAVLVVLALLHNLSFALAPLLPGTPSYVGTGSYWTLMLNAGTLLLLLPMRRAAGLVVGLSAACLALPWVLNFSAFTPYAGAMIRAQGNAVTVLLVLLCLAWYRQRFEDRAREALMLRQLMATDLLLPAAAPPDATAADLHRPT
ncbi:hypothetical protein [Deinococcus xianganensis]|uniref:Uncharacterized protein n=1 Tax=Deinococcus xianganensis TaxID=1507289 RepID=A0A6I4YQ11_9DEIO|nr:hypothetical protein [Deinococcus xianganensis]MXV19615.1 hypothetical protein [Deinococcus xianganensis]